MCFVHMKFILEGSFFNQVRKCKVRSSELKALFIIKKTEGCIL
jgi:hypothetical protein